MRAEQAGLGQQVDLDAAACSTQPNTDRASQAWTMPVQLERAGYQRRAEGCRFF
jgi:hypothetical protein